MTNKPVLTNFNSLPSLKIQQYERYLPTAFDESLSILQKINKVIYQLNKIGEISNDLVEQWNELMMWIVGNGLTEVVSEEIDKRIEDGVFDELIYRIVGDLTKLKTENKDSLVNALNEVFDIVIENVSKIGDLSELETSEKESLVKSINEIKKTNDVNSQAVITIGEATGFGVINGFKVRQQNVLAMAVEVGDYNEPNIVHLPNGERYVLDSQPVAIQVAESLERIDSVFVNQNGIQYLKGVPSTNPIENALPENSVLLATIRVVPNDTTINDVDITDKRPMKNLNQLNLINKENFVDALNEVIGMIEKVANDYATKLELESLSESFDRALEDVYTEINETETNLITKIGDLETLETNEKINLVVAINEVISNTYQQLADLQQIVSTDIGDLTTLKTDVKDNLVNAINEVIDNTYQQLADLGQIVSKEIGDLSTLKTSVKDNLVNAINEVIDNTYQQLDDLETKVSTEIGDVSLLSTVSKDNLVNAINEVNNSVEGNQELMNQRGVNPVDFGADPTGTTDSTNAFLSAFAVGKKMVLPSGTFLLNNLIVPDDCTIFGSGKRNTVLKKSANGFILDLGRHGVLVDCKVDGNSSQFTGASIVISRGDNFVAREPQGHQRIERCAFENADSYHILYPNANKGWMSRVNKCDFGKTNADASIKFPDEGAFGGNRYIIDCYSDQPIVNVGGADNGIIAFCTTGGTGKAQEGVIFPSDVTHPSEKIIITNNRFAIANGTLVLRGTNHIFTNNEIAGSVTLDTTADKVIYAENVVVGSFQNKGRTNKVYGVKEFFTPEWRASTMPNLGNGFITAYSRREGTKVSVSMQVTFGSSTSFGSGAWSFTIPIVFEGMPTKNFTGTAMSSNGATGIAFVSMTDRTVTIYRTDEVGVFGATSPVVWKAGDTLMIDYVYDVAFD